MKSIQMLLFSLCVALGLCSCGSTQPAYQTAGGYYGPEAYQGGDYGRRPQRQEWQADPNRPAGRLDTHHHSGTESQAQNVHFRVRVDTPRENQPVVKALMDELAEWFRDFHGIHQRPATNNEVIKKAEELINAEPLFAGRTYDLEDKQGTWGVEFDHQAVGEKRRAENPTTTESKDILDQAGIPTTATRLAPARGPERYQPPVSHRKAATATTPTPTRTTPRNSSTPNPTGGPPVIGTSEPELPQ